MLLKNVSSQGVFLYAVDTTSSPYGPKTADDSANITGSYTLDGTDHTGFATAHPTFIGAGVYWQPLSQGETNGNAYAYRWASTTSGVYITPVFGFTSGANLPAIAPGSTGGLPIVGTSPLPSSGTLAAAIWDEVLTGSTHNIANSAGKDLRTLGVQTSSIVYGPATAPSQAGMTSVQIKLDSGASSSTDIYQWDVISITAGTAAGESALITAYDGLTKIATVAIPWTVQPDNTSVFEITPTPMTRVSSYQDGQDPATLVWAAVTRTLTALPAIPNNWLTAAGIAASALNGKGDWATVADVGADTSGTTTLLSRLTATRAGYLDNLTNLDAAVSTRSTYAGADTSGTTTLLSRLTSGRASNLDNLDAAISTRSTYAGGAVASVTGAVGSVTAAVTISMSQAVPTSNTAQTVGDALNAARADGFGPWTLDADAKTLTMYASNGSTVIHTFNLDSATAPKQRT